MPDIFYLMSKWWKHLLGLTILSMIVAGAANFFQPKRYLSVATALPSSSYMADKARIFNENIQALYSTLGSVDELDMMIGTGQLDTIYLAVTDQFHLQGHYKPKDKGELGRARSAEMLRKNTRINKSDYGELKIKVWDKDKNLAPQLANALLDKIQIIHTNLHSENNKAILAGLRSGVQQDTSNINQQAQYRKMITEYELMVKNPPAALLVVEKARVPQWPEKAKMSTIVLAAGFFGFIFGLLVVLVLEKRKSPAA
jgi:uncharacterized protein involved in exopolysaccharide biosynthesis